MALNGNIKKNNNMAKYNKKKETVIETVINHQSGVGFKYDEKTELIAMLASGMENKFYEKESEREKRLTQVINNLSKTDPTFVAKALVYYRSIVGQRSVTQYGAMVLAKHLSGHPLGAKFYSKRSRKENKGGIIFRLDDMYEITAAYMAKNPSKRKRKNGTPTLMLPNSIKKGFKMAIEEADDYELAKYQAKGSTISLVDIFNLVHPVPKNAKQKETFAKLMKGELKQFNTVEDKNTKTGQDVAEKVKSGKLTKDEAIVVLQEAKEDNYAELITTRKIGYLALLRNLRNILKNTNNTKLIDEACSLLTDQKLIRQSLVFPHQIDIALEIMLTEFNISQMGKFAKALDTAYELAIPNLTELFKFGKTAVVLDSSGSMSSRIRLSNNKAGSVSALDKAALIAATFAKGLSADVYHFADRCAKISYNPNDTVNTIKKTCLSAPSVGGGTSFECIMRTIGNDYDRVFIISDCQGQSRLSSTKSHIYAVDICGYGTTSIRPNSKVYQLFGYSSDIFELTKVVEMDPLIVFKAIEAIEI